MLRKQNTATGNVIKIKLASAFYTAFILPSVYTNQILYNGNDVALLLPFVLERNSSQQRANVAIFYNLVLCYTISILELRKWLTIGRFCSAVTTIYTEHN